MPTDYIRYDLLVQEALRSVVRKVLGDAARNGLPGEHHFNIAFKTQAQGVVIPPAVLQRYPDEMAIILQHEFWDLEVTQRRLRGQPQLFAQARAADDPVRFHHRLQRPFGSVRLQARTARRDEPPPRRPRRCARPRASRTSAAAPPPGAPPRRAPPPPPNQPKRRRRRPSGRARPTRRRSFRSTRSATRSESGPRLGRDRQPPPRPQAAPPRTGRGGGCGQSPRSWRRQSGEARIARRKRTRRARTGRPSPRAKRRRAMSARGDDAAHGDRQAFVDHRRPPHQRIA